MDGKRLRVTSGVGTYGAASSTYQTEIADFSNVTASSATTGTGSGAAPSYFTVQLKNGLIYEYGNTQTSGAPNNGSQILRSGVVAQWLLDKVSDRNGNNYVVNYGSVNGATGLGLPTSIAYTPTTSGSTTYAYTIYLGYGTRLAQNSATTHTAITGYQAGVLISNPNLLNAIELTYRPTGGSSTIVRNYTFAYNVSPTTTRALLGSITQCGGSAGTDCLAPTIITYQPGAAGVGAAVTLTSSQATAPAPISSAYDLNGDGFNDLVWMDNGTVYVAFGSSSGFGPATSTGLTSRPLIGRVDGSASDSLLVNGGAGTNWTAYKWNVGSSAFAPISTGAPVDGSGGFAFFADVNGDGLPDLIQAGTDGNLHVRLNTSSDGMVSFASTELTTIPIMSNMASNSNGTRRLDFFGSGQDDLVGVIATCGQLNHLNQCIQNIYNVYALHFTGTTFTQSVIYTLTTVSPDIPAGIPVDYADYNDDGCTDVLFQSALVFSACNGTPAQTVSITAGTAVGGMDWDGDGWRDVLVSQSNGYLGVLLSLGSNLSPSIIGTSIPNSTSYATQLAHNATGDGQDALVVLSTSTPYAIQYYLHNSAGQPPDLLSNVTDGFGNSVSPSYVSIANGNYTFGASDATYPMLVSAMPLYVVSQYSASDGAGGTYSNQFSYHDLYSNLQGRGLQGFWWKTAYDSRTTLYHTQFYLSSTFPYAGMINQETVTQSAGTLVSDLITSQATTTLDSTTNNQRYFPYYSTKTLSQYGYLGNQNGALISTTQTNYTFDSYGNATTIANTVTDNDPGSPYSGHSWTTTTNNIPDVDTGTWCLPLVTQTQVAYTASDGSTSVTRTKAFTPDLTNCRYTQIVTEPSSSTYMATEVLGYDSFGNVNSDALTGVSMSASPATRTKLTNWGPTGQLPTLITDPSGAQTTLNYNYAFGLRTSLTDPNSTTSNPIITSWSYDDFGRLQKETRPDGTYTSWGYSDCANAGGCIIGSHALTAAYGVYDNATNLITDGGIFYDSMDRPLATSKELLASGVTQRIDSRYDSLGRLAQQSAPCLGANNPTVACTYWTTYGYDALNRPTQVQRPISSTNSSLQTTSYLYGGDEAAVVDPYNNRKTLIRDANGWLREVMDDYGYTVTLAYDAAGSKTGTTDSLGRSLLSNVSYAYGISPFRLSATDARGAWGFTYDALGEKTAWTDAKGQRFSATYDSLSRPLTRSEPDLFTQWTWGSSPANDNVGKLQSVCTGVATPPTPPTACSFGAYLENDAYDSLGRQYQRSVSYGLTGLLTYTYQYSATTGLLNTLTYPVSTSGDALQLQYGYSNGILQSIIGVVSGSPNVTVWTANTMNPAGQVTQETLGSGSTNLFINRTYDAVTGWLGATTSGIGGGASLQNQSFLYDEMGNVTQRQDNNLGLTENLYPDNDYRLGTSSLNGTQNLALSYNADGGIASKSDVGPNLQSYTATWTSYNYPASIATASESVSFTYGPNRERLQQNHNNGTDNTFYLGGLLELYYNSAGVASYRHYIYAGNEPVAIYTRTSTLVNTWSYLLSDHQGSVSAIVDGSGAVDVDESFSAYGVRRNPSTWSGSPSGTDLTTIAGLSSQGYTFQTALGQSMGFNHMNGRVQDAITGRFLSPDPHIPDPSDAQSYNRYAYVNNNPLTLVDPSGFEGEYSGGGGGGGGIFVCYALCDYASLTGGASNPNNLQDNDLNPPSGAGAQAPPLNLSNGASAGTDASSGSSFLTATPTPQQCASVVFICNGSADNVAGVSPSPSGSGLLSSIGAWISGESQALYNEITWEINNPGQDLLTYVPDMLNAMAHSDSPLVGPLAGIGGVAAVESVGSGSQALVPMADAALNYGTIRTVAGYELGGTTGLVGSSYSVNIWALYATDNSQGLGALANALQTEASSAGASSISITGNAIINPGLMNMSGIAGRYGFSFSVINPTTISLWARVP
jgi:RHS repeat-associated protein